HYRKVFNQQHVEPRLRNAALKRSAEYLERYFWLITFAAYIGSENLDVAFVKGGYKNWLHEKPEVQALKWSVREELQSRQGDAVMESIINKRSGSILCKGSILKKCQRTSSRLQIDEEGEGSTETIREEAHIYVNGIPFVLRELRKPVDILTHVGIAGVVVETRLKEDILSEVRETGGRMLLHREEYSTASNQSQVIGYWEYIQPEDVKTSAEIYAAQERDALASNVDAIHGCKDEWCGERLFTSSGAIHKQDFGQAYSRQRGLNYFSKSIPILEDLHHLTITHEDIEYCWESLPCLLERSPNLKTLIIRGGLHYGQDDVCRCLSSYSCLVTSALEVVEVSLHDSTSRAEWDQLEHFLGKLPCLQLLKVRCGGKISREEKLRIARELCQLPKASSKCKIVCT
ncbi:unnamed protein product, partial [Brassica rapa subsp. trilocularis]